MGQKKQKAEEVEVTPQMVEAGVSELRSKVHEGLADDFAELAADVYRAMKRVSASEFCESTTQAGRLRCD